MESFWFGEDAQGSLFPTKPYLHSKATQKVTVKPTGRPKNTATPALLSKGVPWVRPLPPLHTKLHVGLCSFTDPDWRGTFYQEDEGDLLAAYAKFLSIVEVDSTFYGIPRPSVIESWRHRTPENFRFALKFPREITHERMLDKCEYLTGTFIDISSRLGSKLGPFLLQFPYAFNSSYFTRLESFLEKLPTEYRYVIEVRHRSWLRQPFYEMAEKYNIAISMIDHTQFPRVEKTTTDFAYIRWLGDRRETPGPFVGLCRDPKSGLRWWSKKIHDMITEGKTVYAFANNYYAGHAPETLLKFVEVF